MEPADSAWNLQHAVSDVCLCEGLHTSKLGVLQLFLCFLFHWQQVPRSPALWPRRRGAWQENKDCVAEFCGLTLLQCFTLFLGFPSSTAMLPPAQTPDQAPAATTPPFGPLCQRSSQPHGLPVHVLTVHGLHALIHPPNHTNNSPSSPLLPSSPVFPVLPLLPMWSALITVSAQSPSTWSASSTAVFVFGLSYFRSRVHYSYKRN